MPGSSLVQDTLFDNLGTYTPFMFDIPAYTQPHYKKEVNNADVTIVYQSGNVFRASANGTLSLIRV